MLVFLGLPHMTRDEAIRRGLARYRGDKPCRAGHNSERYTSTGNCIACMAASRSRIAQYRNGRAQGWTTVETQVPPDQVHLLRDVVHLLRLQSSDAGLLRGDLRDGVDSLLQRARVPVVECLTLTKSAVQRAPVAPYQPTARELESGQPEEALADPSLTALPAGMTLNMARRFGLVPTEDAQ